MDSLSQQISDLINPLPTLIDPEDDINVETSAQNLLKDYRSDGNVENQTDVTSEDISLLRRKQTQNLSDINKRYSGRKVDRKLLEEYEPNSEESDENEDTNDSQTGDDSDDREDIEFYSDNLRAPMASSEGSESGSDSQSSDESIENEEEDEEEVEQQMIDSNDDYIKQFSNINVSDEIAKGMALKNQLLIWDNLLELRIKLQKVLIDFNKFPQFDCLSHLKTSDDKQLSLSLKESSKLMKNLFKHLVDIDSSLDSQNDLISTKSHSTEDQSNAEMVGSDDEIELKVKRKSGQKRKSDSLSEYSQFLSKRHCDLMSKRVNIIDKWYEKTRFTSSSLKHKSLVGLEQSSNQQIDRILSDMERLITRTQTKRSLYSIIGKTGINEKIESNESIDELKTSNIDEKELDPEIFDDDDFYHQLLRELIDSKTGSDSGDPLVLSRKWIEIQKLRNKMKRKVDTKASKGRKIRYDVHSKLINFMAPIDNTTYTEEARNELFGSLFGKRIN